MWALFKQRVAEFILGLITQDILPDLTARAEQEIIDDVVNNGLTAEQQAFLTERYNASKDSAV